MRLDHIMTILFFLPLLLGGATMAVDYGSKLTAVIIPGFGSSNLRLLSTFNCPSLRDVFTAADCWSRCLLLDPFDQSDHPECTSRPVTGLFGITDLDFGFGSFYSPSRLVPTRTRWKEVLTLCVDIGIEPVAAPYDWRLPPAVLEERDGYFHQLRLTFETAQKLHGRPSVVIAHSFGNNIFRYFLEWLKLEIPPKHYMEWVDQHINAYFALGAPLLGSVDTVRSTLSPVSEEHRLTYQTRYDDIVEVLSLHGTTRRLFNSYSSSLWMMPFSKNCKAKNSHCKHFCGNVEKDHSVYHCDEEEYRSKYSGWPTNIINIEIPSTKTCTSMVCSLPTQMSFTAREIANTTLFKAIENYDPSGKGAIHQLKKFYHDDPVMNPLTPWERPPIKNVFCIYGVDLKTEVGYHVAPSNKPYPDNWIITNIIFETNGSLESRSGTVVDGHAGPITGDGKVPYHSLSWCKNWLGPKVNITMAPQAVHNRGDVQVKLNIEHPYGSTIVPNMKKAEEVKYITFYEDSESIPGKKTGVWEIDKVNHWDLVKSQAMMRELSLEMWHEFEAGSKNTFVTKGKRGPVVDKDCYWEDSAKEECALQDYCEFRYSYTAREQSCRLRRHTPALMLLEYE